jgi:hypothetical protein
MKAVHLEWSANPALPWAVENDEGKFIAQFECEADAELFAAAKRNS